MKTKINYERLKKLMESQRPSKYAMTDYQRFIHASRYARWLTDEGRRETWEETVARYTNFFGDKYPEFPKNEIYDAIHNMEVMPSMRCLMTAGPALDRDNVAGYNCSFLAIDHPASFSEVMYVLMCGTGVGFSVERQFISKLPSIAEEFHDTDTVIKVKDSRVGWASAFRELISLLYSGRVPKWDTTAIRPAGARLATFGGRASGPKPLEDLFSFAVFLFKKAAGRKLNSLECHDLVCKVADIVIVGGVRRSALISLSNLTDERMRNAKNGAWWEENVQRALANNSVAYTEKPDLNIFLKEWGTLYESRSGERGVFNRVAATRKAASNGRRITDGYEYGTNPCGEIILRSKGLCNLSEVVVRNNDTLNDLKRKIRLATIIGTYQSTLTNFRFLRKEWQKNAQEERLLGVSLTGIMDHPILSGKEGFSQLEVWLTKLREHAIETNKEWAGKLGIEPSAAITTIKPSGTVSQLVDCSSGIHPAYSEYYIRTVRMDNKDPLTTFFKEQGVPNEPDVTKPYEITVFSFPQKASASGITRDEVDAMYQMKLYSVYQKHYTEHNPSITIYYKDEDFLKLGAWIFDNFFDVSGVSLLPHSDHVYAQAPYQEINREQYIEAVNNFPKIDWSNLVEKEDTTTAVHELSCSAGVCEVVGI
ncbi:rnr iI [Caudoviricetes sp.]|nr:rnr iI [Caudoviricetes sp.]